MNIARQKLKEMLVGPGHITAGDFDAAGNESEKTGRKIEEILVEKNLIKDEQLGRLVAETAGFDFIDLRKEKIDETILGLVPEIVARSKGIIAFGGNEREISAGMTDPDDLEIRHLLEKKFGRPVKPYYITEDDFRDALSHYRSSLGEALKKAIDDADKSGGEKLVVEIVDLILEYAHYSRASDIHIEPLHDNVSVRFRIDGLMHKVVFLPDNFLDPVMMRLKIMAGMKTDEHMSAQDGRLRFSAGGDEVDVRISIIPVTRGENAVMRLLSADARKMSLDSLGLSPSDLARVRHAAKSPYGMIIVAGPTGSGKTTTLYEIVKTMNSEEVHIASIEDPVEYDIEGVSQIQVNQKTNLTFAQGLRAIVRQDPDIILVGEIRDRETAEIAVNSAMTGHLVLSTFHANDAAVTLLRLLDMGVEPFLIASTVNLVIGQRLVRVVCSRCRHSYEPPEEEKVIMRANAKLREIIETKRKKNIDKLRLYKGEGCKVCAGTGYGGRIGIFETLEMRQNIKELVARRAPSGEIMAAARVNGMSTVMEDGMNKVFSGTTTLAEVLRVAME